MPENSISNPLEGQPPLVEGAYNLTKVTIETLLPTVFTSRTEEMNKDKELQKNFTISSMGEFLGYSALIFGDLGLKTAALAEIWVTKFRAKHLEYQSRKKVLTSPTSKEGRTLLIIDPHHQEKK